MTWNSANRINFIKISFNSFSYYKCKSLCVVPFGSLVVRKHSEYTYRADSMLSSDLIS